MRGLIAIALIGLSTAAGAQSSQRTIAPGMSRAQVVAVLGTPATERTVSEFRYLFYQNSCGKRCGMNDLVVLKEDKVVDAILRSPSRRYSGTSSSPEPISARDAARAKPSQPLSGPSAASGERGTQPAAKPNPRMRPPSEANDVRPSVPLNPPTMPPASSPSPAPRAP